MGLGGPLKLSPQIPKLRHNSMSGELENLQITLAMCVSNSCGNKLHSHKTISQKEDVVSYGKTTA